MPEAFDQPEKTNPYEPSNASVNREAADDPQFAARIAELMSIGLVILLIALGVVILGQW
jgi:hypothetical protein